MFSMDGDPKYLNKDYEKAAKEEAAKTQSQKEAEFLLFVSEMKVKLENFTINKVGNAPGMQEANELLALSKSLEKAENTTKWYRDKRDFKAKIFKFRMEFL